VRDEDFFYAFSETKVMKFSNNLDGIQREVPFVSAEN
jgi:hypothetical protein